MGNTQQLWLVEEAASNVKENESCRLLTERSPKPLRTKAPVGNATAMVKDSLVHNYLKMVANSS